MVTRVKLSPTRILVSRPGYDVNALPAFTSDYLALDSNFTAGSLEHPLQVGTLFGLTPTASPSISYGTTYPTAPSVQIFPFDTYGTIYSYESINSGGNRTNRYNLFCFTDHFVIHALISDGWTSAPHNWIYLAWATS